MPGHGDMKQPASALQTSAGLVRQLHVPHDQVQPASPLAVLSPWQGLRWLAGTLLSSLHAVQQHCAGLWDASYSSQLPDSSCGEQHAMPGMMCRHCRAVPEVPEHCPRRFSLPDTGPAQLGVNEVHERMNEVASG